MNAQRMNGVVRKAFKKLCYLSVVRQIVSLLARHRPGSRFSRSSHSGSSRPPSAVCFATPWCGAKRADRVFVRVAVVLIVAADADADADAVAVVSGTPRRKTPSPQTSKILACSAALVTRGCRRRRGGGRPAGPAGGPGASSESPRGVTTTRGTTGRRRSWPRSFRARAPRGRPRGGATGLPDGRRPRRPPIPKGRRFSGGSPAAGVRRSGRPVPAPPPPPPSRGGTRPGRSSRTTPGSSVPTGRRNWPWWWWCFFFSSVSWRQRHSNRIKSNQIKSNISERSSGVKNEKTRRSERGRVRCDAMGVGNRYDVCRPIPHRRSGPVGVIF